MPTTPSAMCARMGTGACSEATDKPELRADVAAYFVSRMEGR